MPEPLQSAIVCDDIDDAVAARKHVLVVGPSTSHVSSSCPTSRCFETLTGLVSQMSIPLEGAIWLNDINNPVASGKNIDEARPSPSDIITTRPTVGTLQTSASVKALMLKPL